MDVGRPTFPSYKLSELIWHFLTGHSLEQVVKVHGGAFQIAKVASVPARMALEFVEMPRVCGRGE